MSPTSTFHDGGPVFIAILACGFVALVVFAERLIVLHRARIRFSDFLAGVFNILSKGKVREALAICDETTGPVARIAHSAIMHKDDDPELMRLAMENAGKTEVARMERRLRVISTIMHIAPLMGLLGCVLGGLRTIRFFQSSQQLVQTLDLTSGLTTALLCGAAGLAVTILSYVMFNVVIVRIDRVILDMEQSSADILAFMHPTRAMPADVARADSSPAESAKVRGEGKPE